MQQDFHVLIQVIETKGKGREIIDEGTFLETVQLDQRLGERLKELAQMMGQMSLLTMGPSEVLMK